VVETLQDAALDFVDKLFEKFTGRAVPQPARATLSTSNRLTDVQITLIGAEKDLGDLAARVDAVSKHPKFLEPATYMVFDTKEDGRKIVLMQFKMTLACSAAQAEQDCHRVFSRDCDGDGLMGYHFAILGERA
jgi:hypothetical protein